MSMMRGPGELEPCPHFAEMLQFSGKIFAIIADKQTMKGFSAVPRWK